MLTDERPDKRTHGYAGKSSVKGIFNSMIDFSSIQLARIVYAIHFITDNL